MRVAIVHYWLLGMRGGEKVVEALCRLFPQADLYTLFYDPENVSPLIRSHVVHASFLNPARRFYRSLLPLMPLALESFDLTNYDLVISSESGPAKGVLVPAAARHVCYCHTPMRYLWDLFPSYLHEFTRNPIKRAAHALAASPLRVWDFATAARVDQFVANSTNVQRRIRRAYGRDSLLVHPPVAVDTFHWGEPRDYYLMVGELVAYKRLEYAVRMFSKIGMRLKIVGGGPEYTTITRLAGPSIEFCGRVSDPELRNLYAHAKALIVPGEEDFGITMVEALASGKPVIALDKGGACEIVDRDTGILFPDPTEKSLTDAIQRFESAHHAFDPVHLQMSATRFSEARFEREMSRIIFEPANKSIAQSAVRHEIRL